jgi:V/A-type H+-transporting ATPase subunit I
MAYGRVDEKNLPVLERSLLDIPHIVYPYKKEETGLMTTLIICLRRDRAALDKVLKDIGWQKMEIPQGSPLLSREVQEKLRAEIKQFRIDLTGINTQLGVITEKYLDRLVQVKFFIMVKKALLEAEKFSYTTDRTVLLTGWIPSEDRLQVLREVKKIDPASYVEETKAENVNIAREDIPVRIKHNALVKPFELLIESYGIPRYGTIDPTIFVAISFLLMFGVMFGDVGQGLVLVLASLFLRRSKNQTVKQAGALVLYSGLSATLFGFLYGSYFGIEARALWIRPIEHIMEMFADAVILGIILISLGILINIINAFRDKNYLKILFDKAGLISGLVYWAGIGVGIKLFIQKTAVAPFYFYIITAGLLALFLKPIIEGLFRKKSEGFFITLIESVMELVEVVMGYLANTISFIRVAAFALAHTGLFIAIFQLSDLLKNVGGGTASLLVIIVGNIFVILLEGLVVSIQSVRLNYYEFFSKFFVTGNKVYKPLTL